MLEAQLRDNREVILRAAENVKRRGFVRAGSVKYNRLKGAHRPYDDRNIIDLAAILIKEQGATEEEIDANFSAEVERMIDAFEGKADIKPYIKAMYDNIRLDIDSVDWSDIEQVEHVLAYIKLDQALASARPDFDAVEL